MVTNEQVTHPVCAGCNQVIGDKYLLKVVGQVWHEHCLKCSCCNTLLTEKGSTLFVKSDLLFCKEDYYRLYGRYGQCSACLQTIPALEMVMKAQNHVYHLHCFSCQYCGLRLNAGDRFYLIGNRLYCERHNTESNTAMRARPLARQEVSSRQPYDKASNVM